MADLSAIIGEIAQLPEDQQVEPILQLLVLGGYPDYVINAIPAWIRTKEYINLHFLNCYANVPGVPAVTNFQVDYYAYNYALPGIILGCAWPLVILGLGIAIWRISTKPSPRALMLLLSMILCFGEGAAIAGAKVVKPYSVSINVHRAYTISMVTFGTLRMMFLLLASALRFGAVYASHKLRQALIAVVGAIAVVSAVAALAVAYIDLVGKNGITVPPSFWALTAISPVMYLIVGVAVFTRSLRKAARAFKTSNAGLSYLQMTNNGIMAITLGAVIITLAVEFSLDIATSYFVTPNVYLFNTVWTVGENCFEILTIWQRTAASSSVGSAKNSTAQLPALTKNSTAQLPALTKNPIQRDRTSKGLELKNSTTEPSTNTLDRPTHV
ncbi:hypothetical protein HDU85_000811 [Gaertneriomyces sp. JEL0708]|nr:hypothetical protein HDU85_000811 [Gaertneriomyces sp. JEL0708]